MGKSKHFSRQPQPYDAKIDETASKDWKILLGTTTNAPPEPSLFDRVSLEIKKTDSTTAKTIAEPYLLESVIFYRAAMKKL